jgi:hypothetical protein
LLQRQVGPLIMFRVNHRELLSRLVVGGMLFEMRDALRGLLLGIYLRAQHGHRILEQADVLDARPQFQRTMLVRRQQCFLAGQVRDALRGVPLLIGVGQASDDP